ncbi:MAG: Gfo/Idh/MocA family oxidoreductase [Chloroflexi bacterium]|nr:Gfo/Idh/MocA family oxidoreductase [Chloroflexota bacterium]
MRYLLVGLGNIGRKRQALLGDRCVATADPFNADAQYAAAEDCPVDAYDAVVLATPNQSKLDLLAFCVERGKHVLVEKPLLLTDNALAQRLSDAAKSTRAVWYTSYNHRFETLIGSARNHLRSGSIGELYHARLFYGNGTVGNVVGTWRDQGLGVLEDLGSHLLDLAADLFGCGGQHFQAWSLEHHEAASLDHCILASADDRIVLEMSYLAWKNTFSIDAFGSRGSLHVSGLQKWGPSELVLRERVLPSGVPIETHEQAPGGVDPTWQRDLEYFEALCAAPDGSSSAGNDVWISRTLMESAGA